ncbi:hypothetical protein B0H14DRAFT_3475590 [Mycena olivaceomarginata]|nr:hypothetical protein B0H14DRAFT_3475590 [Mycena olivaceomarginata]
MTTAVLLLYMRKEKSGTIVMLGSRTSWRPENTVCPSYAHWRFLNLFLQPLRVHTVRRLLRLLLASSKAALRVFSETLASDVAQFSIRVLIIEPAAFRTDALISNPMYTGNPLPVWKFFIFLFMYRQRDELNWISGISGYAGD